MPTHATASNSVTNSSQPQCVTCRYFQVDRLDTGFCRFHKMYVLPTFDCPEFIENSDSVQGGGAVPE